MLFLLVTFINIFFCIHATLLYKSFINYNNKKSVVFKTILVDFIRSGLNSMPIGLLIMYLRFQVRLIDKTEFGGSIQVLKYKMKKRR